MNEHFARGFEKEAGIREAATTAKRLIKAYWQSPEFRKEVHARIKKTIGRAGKAIKGEAAYIKSRLGTNIFMRGLPSTPASP